MKNLLRFFVVFLIAIAAGTAWVQATCTAFPTNTTGPDLPVPHSTAIAACGQAAANQEWAFLEQESTSFGQRQAVATQATNSLLLYLSPGPSCAAVHDAYQNTLTIEHSSFEVAVASQIQEFLAHCLTGTGPNPVGTPFIAGPTTPGADTPPTTTPGADTPPTTTCPFGFQYNQNLRFCVRSRRLSDN